MRVFVFVNHVDEIGFRQTTALLIAASIRAGHEVYLADVGSGGISPPASNRQHTQTASTHRGSSLPSAFISVDCVRAQFDAPSTVSSQSVADFSRASRAQERQRIMIRADDIVLIRTNPGRDVRRSNLHAAFIDWCRIAASCGVRVLNHPEKIDFYASKAAVLNLPEAFRPGMLVSDDLDEIASFIKGSDCDCVIKPLIGSRGENVIRVHPSSSDITHLLTTVYPDQSVVVQRFVESDEPGDQRVIVFDGDVIRHGSHFAGIHRIPAKGDFRANLHAGGRAAPLQLTARQLDCVQHTARMLYNDGIRLAGIDLVGHQVIEFNVYSTGGLYDANRFAQTDFTDQIVNQIMQGASSAKSLSV